MFCRQCGRKLSDGEKVCSGCGATVQNDAIEQKKIIAPNSIKESYKSKKTINPVLETIIIGVILLIINLPLSYLAFFGEEYGWRYFFQPALQKKYGLRKGVILLGVLWGLWHIPLNFLYYSPKTGVFSFMIQVTLCVGIGVFMGWLYMKTGNIWSVVIVHYLQNNIGAIFFGASPVNVVLDFKDVLIALIVYMLVYLPFLNTKEYKLKSMSDSSEKLRLH